MEMLQGSFEMSRLCRVIWGRGVYKVQAYQNGESHGIEDEVEPGRIWQGFRVYGLGLIQAWTWKYPSSRDRTIKFDSLSSCCCQGAVSGVPYLEGSCGPANDGFLTHRWPGVGHTGARSCSGGP